jgi:hypothetical protein
VNAGFLLFLARCHAASVNANCNAIPIHQVMECHWGGKALGDMALPCHPISMPSQWHAAQMPCCPNGMLPECNAAPCHATGDMALGWQGIVAVALGRQGIGAAWNLIGAVWY